MQHSQAAHFGLPIESVRRIACDNDRIVLVEDERGEPLTVGRKSRAVPACGYRRADIADDCLDSVSEYLDTRASAEGFFTGVEKRPADLGSGIALN